LLTPISRLTMSQSADSGSVASSAAESSSVVQPVVAMIRGSSIASPAARSAATSCAGQRPSGATPSPMV
jgi:hypothetical protein